MNWNQYFPTCSFDENKNRDIALEEYKACCKVLESEEKIFDSLIKHAFSFGTIGVSLLIGSLGKIENFFPAIQKEYLLLYMALVSFFLCLAIVQTFGMRQKSIVLAKRKIIVLRRMLGLDYGSQAFLFPKGDIEGSSSPFEIQLKADWRLFIILILFWTTWLSLGLSYSNEFVIPLTISILLSFIIFIYIYLKTIQDINENFQLILFREIFQILGLKFVENMEDALYRAKLSAMECRRQKIDMKDLKEIVILIEDNRFYRHGGIDIKAMTRGGLSRLKRFFPFCYIKSIKHLALSGGSTITQQLLRTLFIREMDKKKIRRKIAEIVLSYLWLDRILIKSFQLEIYLNSVRFANRVHGIVQAMEYFFGKMEKNPSKAQSFFLVERISVVSNSILPKTLVITKRMKDERVLSEEDIKELILIYEKCAEKKIIQPFYKETNMIEELKKLIA